MTVETLEAVLAQRRAVLAGHHVELSRRQQQVLYLRCQGFAEREIGPLLGCKLNTVQNHMTAARVRVVPSALEPSSVNAVDWAWMHLSCCLITADMTLNRQLIGNLRSRTAR